MKIKEVCEDYILFDNYSILMVYHERDCCETNYADFEQLEKQAYYVNFPEDLEFELVDGCGFRFGSKERKYFIPCYSVQNGYYSSHINIIFNGKLIGDIECQERFCD